MAITHEVPAGANIFADLGFELAEAENLHVRARLMHGIKGLIEEQGLKQADAAKLFGVSQPRISDLKRGKIDAFTIDSLVNMLAEAGFRVDVSVRSIPDRDLKAVKESGAFQREIEAERGIPAVGVDSAERMPA
jgi:predicted XRE-type DNA-binding protein